MMPGSKGLSHRLPDSLPLYDYAPDVRVVGDYVYFSASRELSISGIRTCFSMMMENSIFTGAATT